MSAITRCYVFIPSKNHYFTVCSNRKLEVPFRYNTWYYGHDFASSLGVLVIIEPKVS